MQFRVLGPLEGWRGEARVDLGRRKQRAVLAMLLLQPNRVVSAERIVDLLWGDDVPASASASLHAYVSNLRRVIEPERAPRAPARVLVSHAPGYMIVADKNSLDMLQFEALVASGHAALASGDFGLAEARLGEALALWRSPVLLADLADEAFTLSPAAHLDELRLSAVESRIDALLAQHDEARVVAELEVLVADYPLRERLWGQLMVALYRGGRQAEALRAYQRARAVLADELGIEPGPELRRLEQAVLEQTEQLVVVGDQSAIVSSVESAPPSTSIPLAGRQRELSLLEDVVAAAAGGAKRFVLIAGEAGVGKTALAQASMECARDRGFATAIGRCPEGSATVPLWPWARIFRELAVDSMPESIRDLLAEGGGDVGPVLRAELFENIVAFLFDPARRTPVALLFDDIQWADEASHHLLRLVVNEPAPSPLLCIATCRDPAGPATASLDVTLAAFARAPDASRIALEGLDATGIRALVAIVSGSPPTLELAQALHDRTDGNPFYAAEIARLLSAEHALDDAERFARVAIPSTVRDVVRAHIARLPEQAAVLLAVAAVIGPDIDVRLVVEITSVDEDAVLDSFDFAVISGVLVEHPEEIGWYRFSHDLVRDAVYNSLPRSRRAQIHEHALDAIIALYGEHSGGYAHALAFHARNAASRIGIERAVYYSIQATRFAQKQLALDQAIRHMEAAQELAAEEPDPPTRGALELECSSRLAQLRFLRDGDTREVRALWKRVADLARDVDAPARAEALFSLGTNLLLLGDLAGARSAGEELLALGRAEHERRWETNGDVCLSVVMWMGLPVDALEYLERSLQTAAADADAGYAPPSGRPVVPAPIQKARLALVHGLLDNDDTALELARRSLFEGARDREGWSQAWAALYCALLFAILERPDDVLDVVRQAADASGIAYVDAFLAACDAWARTRLGGDEAKGAGAVGVRVQRDRLARAGDGLLQVPLMVLEADLLVDDGRAEEAAALALEARAETERIGEATWDAEVARVACRARPDDPQLRAELRVAAERAEAAGLLYFARRARSQLDRLSEG
jgi:DNA-binding SARP family transcriptional activator